MRPLLAILTMLPCLTCLVAAAVLACIGSWAWIPFLIVGCLLTDVTVKVSPS